MSESDDLRIWTIGHSNQPFEDFAGLLTRQGITLLVDVRRFPGSRTFPHFSREHLSQGLEPAGVDYRWLEGLGGRRTVSRGGSASPNEGWRNKSFRNYADYMMGAEYRDAFHALAEMARARRTAIMCSESVYWRCHRRLISDYAVSMGWRVEHIFAAGTTKPHTLTAGAVVAHREPLQIVYPPAPALFD